MDYRFSLDQMTIIWDERWRAHRLSAHRPFPPSDEFPTKRMPRAKNKYTVSILKDYDTFSFNHLHFSGLWNHSSHSCHTWGSASAVQRFPVLRRSCTLGGKDHPTGSDKNVASLARISLALEITLVFGRGENVPFHSPCNHTIPSNRFQQGFLLAFSPSRLRR